MNLFVARQMPVMDYVYDDFAPGEWELPIKPEVKYGMVMYKDCAAVRPDMGNLGIMKYMLVDFNDRLGYKLAYGIATNPITIGLNSRAASTRSLTTSIVDVSTIRFPNGQTLDDCIRPLMNTQRWTREYVESLRQRSFLMGLVHLYGRSWRLNLRGRKEELLYRALYPELYEEVEARIQEGARL